MITVSISHKSQQSRCSITLRVNELAERKLDFQLTEIANIKNESGEKYGHSTVRYFCGEGIAHARRRLELDGGISVNINEIAGTLRTGTEVGISLAVSVGIAKALGRDDYRVLLESQDEWEATTMVS